jgi:hypothetical protein
VAKNPWQLPRGYDASTRKALAQIFAALKNARTHISPAAYEALRLGNVQAFVNLVDWESIGKDIGELEPMLQDFAAKTGVQLYKDGDIVADLLFDIVDQRAVIWAQNHTADLVVEIAEEMRQQIRNVMAESTQGLLTYEQAARKIRTNLSLTSRDSAAVDSYYLRQINKLVKSGMTIDKATEKASARADRYAAKLLRKRSQTIARTELANAASNGRRLGWESGVSEGYIDPASTKEWVAEPDACDICGPMDGVSVPMNDEFPSGVMMPPQHPNCRCAAILLPPEYSDEYWTAYAKQGGNVNATVTIVKHMAGKHDQSTHGKGKGAMANKPVTSTKELSPDQRTALAAYTSASGAAINRFVRTSEVGWNAEGFTKEDMTKFVPLIDSAIEGSTIQDSLQLQRVVGIDAFGIEPRSARRNAPEQLKPFVGATITEKGFLSTTKNAKVPGILLGGKNKVLLTVHAPAGTKALDLKALGLSDSEGEVLFSRDSAFKVLSVKSSPSDDYSAVMEIEVTK